MHAAVHTVLLVGCSDLKLNRLIYPTATAHATLDQSALMFLPNHALDMPACAHTCQHHLQRTAISTASGCKGELVSVNTILASKHA